jgi:ATP-dependent DNA helicase RecQ
MDKYSVLKEFFGHAEFREGQEALIDGILAGRDVLGIMPTGGGKSLCYQVPGLLLRGITLVISPLISLMKDQVAALTENGIPAAFVNSTLTGPQLQTAYQRIREGRYKIIYIAPERLETEGFQAILPGMDISLLAVDEAHCISQWGQDFRSSYLKISEFMGQLSTRPVVAAFTATATQAVRADIVRLLGLENPVQVITGFDRPNLFFDVQRPKNKKAALTEFISSRQDACGIVYCATRATVEKVCDALVEQGFSATRYHAGLSEAERQRNQDDFRFDRSRVMVATNAFGMGIDKSNVSYVVHYNMPKSVEAYYQEAGRAGRDGSPAECLLLYSPGDVHTAKFLIENSGDNEELTEDQRDAVRRQDLKRLDAMVDYCQSTACYRGVILEYFGQTHEKTCGNCGNCQAEYVETDITVPAQKILSCVYRVRAQLGYAVGAALIGQVLTGSKNHRLLELELERLSTYGIMHGTSRSTIRRYIECLENQGYLRTNPAHQALELTEKSSQVLFHGQTVFVRSRKENAPPQEVQTAAPNADLLAALKAERTRLAQAAMVPAYIVFSNATLEDMAAKQPRTLEEFLNVSGVGRKKAAQYGKTFLDVIREWSENR